MSNLKVNTINDASGGSAAVLYGVASPPNSMGFRNRIINGDMRIDQRNAGASVAFAGGNFPVDRIRISTTGSVAAATVKQNLNSIAPPSGFQNYIGLSVTTGSATGSTSAGRITQRIEGFNVADFGFGTAGASSVTLSFWVRASIPGAYGGSLQNSAGNRVYVFSYTISSANTWEYKTVAISGDTSGTWPKDNNIGALLLFSVGAGSTLQSSSGTWGSTYYDTVTGQVDLFATSGATFYITGVQLEAGTVATPFERRDYGRELMMCQRYYDSIALYGTSGTRGNMLCTLYGTNAWEGAWAGVVTAVPMRSSPALSTSLPYVWHGSNYSTMTFTSFSAISLGDGRYSAGGYGSVGTAGTIGAVMIAAASGYVTFNAEL